MILRIHASGWISASLNFAFAAFVCILANPVLKADIYTDVAQSLDWRIASSNTICLIDVDFEDAQFKFSVAEYVKGSRIDVPLHARLLGTHFLSRRYCAATPGEQWMLFFRGKQDSTRLVGAINLTRPTRHYESAPITTREGKIVVLTSANEIIKYVKQRVSLGLNIPKCADPDLADLIAVDYHRAPAAALVGGFPLAITSNYWDQGHDHPDNQETQIYALLVPRRTPIHESLRASTKAKIEKRFGRHGWEIVSGQRSSGVCGTWQFEVDGKLARATLQPEGTYLVVTRSANNIRDLAHEYRFAVGTWKMADQSLVFYSCIHSPSHFETSLKFTNGNLLKGGDIELDNGKAMKEISSPVRAFWFVKNRWYRIGIEQRNRYLREYWKSE